MLACMLYLPLNISTKMFSDFHLLLKCHYRSVLTQDHRLKILREFF